MLHVYLYTCVSVCVHREDIQKNPEGARRDDAFELQLTRLGILAGPSLQSLESSSPEGSLQCGSAGWLSRLSPQFSTVPLCLRETRGIQLHFGFYVM